MGSSSNFKYWLASVFICCWQPKIYAQTPVDRHTQLPLNWQNLIVSPWEDAVLTHTLETTAAVNLIKFSPDGKMLATVEGNQINLWDTSKGKIKLAFATHQATKKPIEIAPVAIAFSPDSRWLATATWGQGLLTPNHGVIVWDTTTGEAILNLEKVQGCSEVSFDGTGEILYTACGRGVTAWSFPQGKKLFSFNLEHPVGAIALSPDGKVMATVDTEIPETGKRKEIKLWQLNRDAGIFLNTLDGHLNHIAQLEFTADNKRLVSSSYDGKIKVWNWHTGEIYQKTNSLHSDRGLFSLSADSRLIAGNFHSSAMTNLITGLPLRNVMVTSQPGEITTIAFSPQGQLFARVQQSLEESNSLIYIWQWSE